MLKSKIPVFILVMAVLCSMSQRPAYAEGTLTFGPREARIEGVVKYSVIGKYRARFNGFKGRIVLDHGALPVESVFLEIDAKSIQSNCLWCDKLARSRRLLNTMRYPQIIFKSDKIIHHDRGYEVRGILEMHGIKKALAFPFDAQIIQDQGTMRKILIVHGSWVIDRKDFNIIWNKYLDRGGVVVGDDFVVNWQIRKAIR